MSLFRDLPIGSSINLARSYHIRIGTGTWLRSNKTQLAPALTPLAG